MTTSIRCRRSRRTWLMRQATGLTLLALRPLKASWGQPARTIHQRRHPTERVVRTARHAEWIDSPSWQALAQRSVDAARSAGAQYAEARLTRLVQHNYELVGGTLATDVEYQGVGVRALVNGYWGFSASAMVTSEEVVRLAKDAVGQAQENAEGVPWTVELGQIPLATGTWATPVRIDPFLIPIEEKMDFIGFWRQCARDAGLGFSFNGIPSWLMFVRQEQVVATSEGALCTQTRYESGGEILIAGGGRTSILGRGDMTQLVHGIPMTGAGWELFLDAQIPEQFASGQIAHELAQQAALPSKPSQVGKYTLVCDGATMAALVEATLGVATQLDRALGYEANAGGTNWIEDPLHVVGTAQITTPLATLTANRSTPGDLATVKWDAEGVEPEPFTLIQDGVLVDFQTTREQAAWLAPFYQRHGRPVRSHGCAAIESAHFVPLQQMPNLSLEPSASSIQLDDLVADVQDGIFVEGGIVADMDAQARTGLLLDGDQGRVREIHHGRLGNVLSGGAILFSSESLWKELTALGGATTIEKVGVTQFGSKYDQSGTGLWMNQVKFGKGQPLQLTSHSTHAVAGTFANQPVIDPLRKA